MSMKNENVEFMSIVFNSQSVKSVDNLTRKDWFAMFYEVFQMFGNNEKLYDYRNELMSAIDDATDVIVAKNRYEKDDNSVT